MTCGVIRWENNRYDAYAAFCQTSEGHLGVLITGRGGALIWRWGTDARVCVAPGRCECCGRSIDSRPRWRQGARRLGRTRLP